MLEKIFQRGIPEQESDIEKPEDLEKAGKLIDQSRKLGALAHSHHTHVVHPPSIDAYADDNQPADHDDCCEIFFRPLRQMAEPFSQLVRF